MPKAALPRPAAISGSRFGTKQVTPVSHLAVLDDTWSRQLPRAANGVQPRLVKFWTLICACNRIAHLRARCAEKAVGASDLSTLRTPACARRSRGLTHRPKYQAISIADGSRLACMPASLAGIPRGPKRLSVLRRSPYAARMIPGQQLLERRHRVELSRLRRQVVEAAKFPTTASWPSSGRASANS
jgi:hypothetical protein